MDSANAIITETRTEKVFIARNYNVPLEKIMVIPNGIESFFEDDGSIYKYIPKGEPYALSIGRFDKNKNQLNLIKGIKNTGITMVFIGGPHFSKAGKEYYKKCVEASAGFKNIVFLGWQDIESPLLKSAYANAELLVCPSYHETFGMVILEGGVAGCKLAMSNTLPILDYDCFDECVTFNPKSPKDIGEKVEIAFKSPKNPSLKIMIENNFSWNEVVAKHIRLYGDLIRNDKKNI